VFDRFTELARRAVVASQDAALALGHDFIGTEHLLLGLAATAGTASEALRENGVGLTAAREATVRLLQAAGVPAVGGQAAKQALASIGIDVAEIQRRADAAFGPGTFQFPRPAYTPRAKKALELTVQEAAALGQQDHGQEHIPDIDTGHILLGLLAEGEGVALQVLAELGVDLAALRQSVLARTARSAS